MANVRLPAQVAAFEGAHHQAGAFSATLRERSQAFFAQVEGGGFKEPMLRLKLAFSSSARGEMRALSDLIRHPQGSGAEALAKLDQWMARNPSLTKAMSAPTLDLLKGMLAQRGTAQVLQAEIDRAEAALAKAGVSPTAMQTLAREANTDGLVQKSLSRGLERTAERWQAMLMPGARAALSELDRTLSDASLTAGERHQRITAWRQQHPHVDSALVLSERGAQDVGMYFTDLARWHPEMDAQYTRARGAVLAAFGGAS